MCARGLQQLLWYAVGAAATERAHWDLGGLVGVQQLPLLDHHIVLRAPRAQLQRTRLAPFPESHCHRRWCSILSCFCPIPSCFCRRGSGWHHISCICMGITISSRTSIVAIIVVAIVHGSREINLIKGGFRSTCTFCRCRRCPLWGRSLLGSLGVGLGEGHCEPAVGRALHAREEQGAVAQDDTAAHLELAPSSVAAAAVAGRGSTFRPLSGCRDDNHCGLERGRHRRARDEFGCALARIADEVDCVAHCERWLLLKDTIVMPKPCWKGRGWKKQTLNGVVEGPQLVVVIVVMPVAAATRTTSSSRSSGIALLVRRDVLECLEHEVVEILDLLAVHERRALDDKRGCNVYASVSVQYRVRAWMSGNKKQDATDPLQS